MTNPNYYCQICKDKATMKLEDSINLCDKCYFQMQKEAFFSYGGRKI